MKKRALAIILTLVMIFSLAACNGNGDGSGNPASTPSAPANTAPAATEKGGDSSGDGEQVISKYGYDLTQYASIDWPAVHLTTSASQAEIGSISMMTRFYIDMITEASGGNITFTEYWNATFCAGTDNYENIRDGIIDYGEVSSNHEYSTFFLYNINFAIPFCSPDFALCGEALTRLSKMYPDFTEMNEKAGVYVSSVRGIENYLLPSNQDLKEDTFTLAWFNGARIAVGSVFFSKWVEALGAIPITGGSAASNYENFMNGVIDAAFVSDSLIYDYMYYEVCKSVVEMDIGARGSTMSCWNIDTWNSFSPEVQEALQGIADLCTEEYNKVLNANIATYENKIFNEEGLGHFYLSEELKTEWCEKILSDDAYNTLKLWISEGEDLGYSKSREIMDDFMALFEELGFTFPFDTSTAY